MAVPTTLAEPRSTRGRVAVVVSGWGSDWGERRATVRLVAGSLALDAEVVVVSLDDRAETAATELPRRRFDGIFPIHSAAAEVRRTAFARFVRAGLEIRSGADGVLPEFAAKKLLEAYSQPSSEALRMLDDLQPDVVVLAGVETLWMARALPVGADRPRVVALPLLGTDQLLSSAALAPLAGAVDAVGTFSDAEHILSAKSIGNERPEILHRLAASFPVNRPGAEAGMAGMATFGRYVLMISGWPDDEHEGNHAPQHEYLRAAVGDVSVAEVRRGRWLVTERGRRYDVPWVASRMNLWRLMARAVVTLDVRPGGPIGREAVESMLFATPVVVPAGSVAAEYAKAANGGLWYASTTEMVDQVRYLLERNEERQRFARAAQEWAEREHTDTGRMVTDVTRLVFADS